MRIARLRISHGHADLHGADRRKKGGMIGNDFAVDRLASHGFIMADQIGDAIACGFIAVAHPHSSQIREGRSEELTSELQSLMRIPYSVLSLKKKNELARNKNK